MSKGKTTISGLTLIQAEKIARREFGNDFLKIKTNTSDLTYDVYVNKKSFDRIQAARFKFSWGNAFRILPRNIQPDIISEIEIEPHEPFISVQAKIKSMIESSDFLSPTEYTRVKRHFAASGFTECVNGVYHFFYLNNRSQKTKSLTWPDTILAEREFGFHEEIYVEDHCSPSTHKNYHEEFLFKDGDQGKILILDRSANKMEIK